MAGTRLCLSENMDIEKSTMRRERVRIPCTIYAIIKEEIVHSDRCARRLQKVQPRPESLAVNVSDYTYGWRISSCEIHRRHRLYDSSVNGQR